MYTDKSNHSVWLFYSWLCKSAMWCRVWHFRKAAPWIQSKPTLEDRSHVLEYKAEEDTFINVSLLTPEFSTIMSYVVYFTFMCIIIAFELHPEQGWICFKQEHWYDSVATLSGLLPASMHGTLASSSVESHSSVSPLPAYTHGTLASFVVESHSSVSPMPASIGTFKHSAVSLLKHYSVEVFPPAKRLKLSLIMCPHDAGLSTVLHFSTAVEEVGVHGVEGFRGNGVKGVSGDSVERSVSGDEKREWWWSEW